jgi:hypothetical protein
LQIANCILQIERQENDEETAKRRQGVILRRFFVLPSAIGNLLRAVCRFDVDTFQKQEDNAVMAERARR